MARTSTIVIFIVLLLLLFLNLAEDEPVEKGSVTKTEREVREESSSFTRPDKSVSRSTSSEGSKRIDSSKGFLEYVEEKELREKVKKSREKMKQMSLVYTISLMKAKGQVKLLPVDKVDWGEVNFIHPLSGLSFSLEEFKAGKADYIPVYREGDPIVGRAPLLIERPGVWGDDKPFHVLFQDGSVFQYKAGTTLDEIRSEYDQKLGKYQREKAVKH